MRTGAGVTVRRRITAMALAAVALAACTTSDTTPGPAATPPASAVAPDGPCGGDVGKLRPIEHVVVVMEENLSIGSLIGDPGSANHERAPFLNRLALECGLATNYHAITQPSHPNYIAAVAGSTYVPPSCVKFACTSSQLDEPSIFGQISDSGGSWRVYVQSMPTRCQLFSRDLYEAGHNPAVWFTRIRDDCRRYNVGIGRLRADLLDNDLPDFAWIVPDDDHNMHTSAGGGDKKIAIADGWLQDRMAEIVATPDYRNGSTVVFITWDEGDLTGGPYNQDCLAPERLNDVSCRVATIVVSRWVTPGTRSDALYSHYGLLKTAETLLGLPHLAHARDPEVNDMIAAFDLGVRDDDA